MTGTRWRVVLALAAALVAEAALATVWPRATQVPALTMAAVVAVGLTHGVRSGMCAGFAVGLVLDVLSGPTVVVGVHALVGVLVGAGAGCTQREDRQRTGAVVLVVGVAAVTLGAVVFIGMQWSLMSATRHTMGSVVQHAIVAGAVVTPIVQRFLRVSAVRPLPQTSART